jgi:hypothetical protein
VAARGQQRHCSPACGNRARVAAHYWRQQRRHTPAKGSGHGSTRKG